MTERVTTRRQERHEIFVTYFEQTDRAEKPVTTAARRMDQGTERAEQGHFEEEQRWTNPFPERDELEQAIQSTITHLNNLPMHKPSSPILTEATTQQWLDWCHTIRLLVSVLREQSTVPGLKDALDKGARMWNNGMKSQDMGDAMAGVKECLLVLGNQSEKARAEFADSSSAPILFGHSGDNAPAGNCSVSKRWRMAHPSSKDGDDGSGQRVWTKRSRALRHFALDKVADEKLMERGSLSLWDNENVSNGLAFRKKADDLGKNVDTTMEPAASCGQSAPKHAGQGVDGRVVPRPCCGKRLREWEQGIFCSIHEQARRQSEENWEQRWRITAETGLVGRDVTRSTIRAADLLCERGAERLWKPVRERLSERKGKPLRHSGNRWYWERLCASDGVDGCRLLSSGTNP